MRTSRRNLLAAGIAAASLAAPAVRGLAGRRTTIKAVAFDGFPIIDPRPVFAKAEELFPGKGEALSQIWRIRQFEYT